QLAGLGVEDGLDEPLVLAERDRLAVADEREAADFDIAALLLGRGLGQADAGDLRLAVGAAGYHALVQRVRVEALDGLDATDTLVARLVRQHRRAAHVADCIDAGYAGPAESIGDDDAALGLHTELLEPQALDVADHADGGDHPLRSDRLRALAVVDH